MKGLLLKDTYVLMRQMKFFFFLIVLFAVMPNMFSFGILYAAMLPYTALAYDERSKWDQLAAAMPYSRRDLVLSKYLLGWISSGSATLIVLASMLTKQVVHGSAAVSLPLLLLAFCCALLLPDVTLPFMFRFGVERGRIFTLAFIVLICATAGGLNTLSSGVNLNGLIRTLTWTLPAAAAVLTPASIFLSLRWYGIRS